MHVLVVGGGIVGLAIAREIAAAGHDVTVCEKERGWARHQTGRNSGVVHSGLYYRPGSLKARMCVAGARSMVDYAREHGVAVRVCGKLVVATAESELPALDELERRGMANGVPVHRLDPSGARDHEPEVRCVAALRVDSTGIIDFVGISEAMAAELRDRGADLRTGTEVLGIRTAGNRVRATTSGGEVETDALVNCAGLHSDRVARLAGLTPAARIVPFRGEYHSLAPGAACRVRGLIYPVPDPEFPFLGLHLTRGIDGEVHAGPNAVLALRREGYRWRDVSAGDLREVFGYRGFWSLARRHARAGVAEMVRSASRRAFAASLSEMVPGIRADDLVPSPAGVRAQAVGPDGALVDDFLLQTAPRQVHVLNAPSPAATSALEIARHVAVKLTEAVPG